MFRLTLDVKPSQLSPTWPFQPQIAVWLPRHLCRWFPCPEALSLLHVLSPSHSAVSSRKSSLIPLFLGSCRACFTGYHCLLSVGERGAGILQKLFTWALRWAGLLGAPLPPVLPFCPLAQILLLPCLL